jgi:hypothetical protein
VDRTGSKLCPVLDFDIGNTVFSGFTTGDERVAEVSPSV